MLKNRKQITRLLASIALIGVTMPAAALAQIFDPTTQDLQGWTVHVEPAPDADAQKKLTGAVSVLNDKLAEITRIVPQKSLKIIQTTPIWVSISTNNQSTVYHPSAQWLSDHGRNPDMGRGVQIQNIDNFYRTLREQPMAVLHEMAHALHDRTGVRNKAVITKAYQNAIDSGFYQHVGRYDDAIKDVKAYAINNEKEYFAELSEAYFGKNDYFPYNREQLKTYDPVGYAMIETVWK